MPNITISIETLADTIRHMNRKELETLTLLLTDEGKKLLKRKRDIERKNVKVLSRAEVFDV